MAIAAQVVMWSLDLFLTLTLKELLGMTLLLSSVANEFCKGDLLFSFSYLIHDFKTKLSNLGTNAVLLKFYTLFYNTLVLSSRSKK